MRKMTKFTVVTRDWKGQYEAGQFKGAFKAGCNILVGVEDQIDTGSDGYALILADAPTDMAPQDLYDVNAALEDNNVEGYWVDANDQDIVRVKEA